MQFALAAGDTAWFAYQSRLTTYGPMRFETNPSSPAFQQWAANYAVRYLNSNPTASGLYLDNSPTYVPFDSGAVIESSSNYLADYGTLMQVIDQAIAQNGLLGVVRLMSLWTEIRPGITEAVHR